MSDDWVWKWEPWFAWYPVSLLTLEIAWMRTVRRRMHRDGYWEYANQ